MQPELSLIVPTYRRPALLARALDSARTASTRPAAQLELIVVDDCPEGSGFEAARAHGARYLAKAGIDRGLSASRNLGIALARGRCLAFLDDDDQFVPGALDALLDAALAGGGLVYGDHELFDAQRRQAVDLSALTLDELLVCNRIPVGSYVLPRAALQQPFDPKLRSHEDWEFLLAHAQRVGLRHVPGVVARIDKTDNASHSMQARRRSLFWLDFLSIYARFPAPHLSEARSRMLQQLGLQVPAALLDFEDRV